MRSPFEEPVRIGLPADKARQLERIDSTGLELSAGTFARKRNAAKRDVDKLPKWRALLRAAR